MNHDYSRPAADTPQETVELSWRERDQTAVACIVDAIATVTGVPPTEQRPLYESVDPDALEQLLDSAAGTPPRPSGLTVSFSHEGCLVEITATGALSVTRRAGER